MVTEREYYTKSIIDVIKRMDLDALRFVYRLCMAWEERQH